MGKMDEMILVVERKTLFGEEEEFQGIENEKNQVKQRLDVLSRHYEVMRRGDAEENTKYKQPIPYVIIRKKDQVFLYKRLSSGGEKRLHDKLSIGVGGHMNHEPGASTFEQVLITNVNRELNEELDIKASKMKLTEIGLINDNSNSVGNVHIGILYVLDLDEQADASVKETDQLEGEWASTEQLIEKETFEKLEEWSKLALNALQLKRDQK